MEATTSVQAEPLVAEAPAVFFTKREGLRLVRRPGAKEVLFNGQQRTIQTSLVYEFHPDGEMARLRLQPGRDVMVEGQENWLAPGQDLDLERDSICALRAHRLFNSAFFEEGNEPDRLRPTEDEFFGLVTEAVAGLDLDKLAGLLEQEQASHNRPLLVNAVQRAIGQVEGMQAQTVNPASGIPD